MTAERRFTFGLYLGESDLGRQRDMSTSLDAGAIHPSIAVEILQDFSSQEFGGRIYVPVAGQWMMATPNAAMDYSWYRDFKERKRGYFVLKGSALLWRIADLRGQQDPERDREYMAVTLTRETRAPDRWESNVHYYDFTPDSTRRWPDKDVTTVAEAWIYSTDKRHTLGIVVLVDGMSLATQVVSLSQAIGEGAALRDRLVRQYAPQAGSLKENKTLLYLWNGQTAT